MGEGGGAGGGIRVDNVQDAGSPALPRLTREGVDRPADVRDVNPCRESARGPRCGASFVPNRLAGGGGTCGIESAPARPVNPAETEDDSSRGSLLADAEPVTLGGEAVDKLRGRGVVWDVGGGVVQREWGKGV